MPAEFGSRTSCPPARSAQPLVKNSCASPKRAAPVGGQDVRDPRLDTMQPQAKLIIEGHHLWQAIRKHSRFAQEHGQSAAWQSQSIGGGGKNTGGLWIKYLRDSVTNNFQ